MKDRYLKYFINHILMLQDGLATYYVQKRIFDPQAVFGIELKTFFNHRMAVDWIKGCVIHDRCATFKLRDFLSQYAPDLYRVQRMDDDAVFDQAARLIKDDYPVVIHPRFELARYATNTVDILCAIDDGASLSQAATCPVLADASMVLKKAFDDGTVYPARYDSASATHNPAQYKINNHINLAARRARLLPHSENHWHDTDTINKVIINAIKIFTLAAPQKLLHNPIETWIKGAVNDFANHITSPWPPPELTQRLLATHIHDWIILKNHLGPTVEEAQEPEETPKKRSIKPPPEETVVEEKEQELLTIEFLYDDNTPLAHTKVEVELPSGEVRVIKLDKHGMGQVSAVEAKQSKITPLEVDVAEWQEQ